MPQPFDLVAPGGADNVWIVEVGRAADHGSFASFVERLHRGGGGGDPGPRRRGGPATCRRPRASCAWGSARPFFVDGVETPLRDHPRHSSPWAEQCHLGQGFDISEGGARLQLDFTHAARRVS